MMFKRWQTVTLIFLYNASGGLWCTVTVQGSVHLVVAGCWLGCTCKRVGRTVRSVQYSVHTTVAHCDWHDRIDKTKTSPCGPSRAPDYRPSDYDTCLTTKACKHKLETWVLWTELCQWAMRYCVFVFLSSKVEQLVAGPSLFIPELSLLCLACLVMWDVRPIKSQYKLVMSRILPF